MPTYENNPVLISSLSSGVEFSNGQTTPSEAGWPLVHAKSGTGLMRFEDHPVFGGSYLFSGGSSNQGVSRVDGTVADSDYLGTLTHWLVEGFPSATHTRLIEYRAASAAVRPYLRSDKTIRFEGNSGVPYTSSTPLTDEFWLYVGAQRSTGALEVRIWNDVLELIDSHSGAGYNFSTGLFNKAYLGRVNSDVTTGMVRLLSVKASNEDIVPIEPEVAQEDPPTGAYTRTQRLEHEFDFSDDEKALTLTVQGTPSLPVDIDGLVATVLDDESRTSSVTITFLVGGSTQTTQVPIVLAPPNVGQSELVVVRGGRLLRTPAGWR